MTAQELLQPIIDAAQAHRTRVDGDYIQDGILYCGRCRTPKECITPIIGLVPCLCRCAEEQRNAEAAQRREREEAARIATLRANGIQDRALLQRRFENSTMTPVLERCRRYVENWPKMYQDNIGLFLWGACGTGKSHAAACIANAMTDRGIVVWHGSLARILNSSFDERETVVNELSRYSLLSLDDLGTERQTEYSLELCFSVINARYNAGKPLIISSNLSPSDLKNPPDMARKRVYERILELCVPVKFDGENIRQQRAAEKMAAARDLLS